MDWRSVAPRNNLTATGGKPAESFFDDGPQAIGMIGEDPIKNYVVLSGLFETCDVQTLKSCRLVCKEWLKLSLDAWRKKAVLGVTEMEALATSPVTKAVLLEDFLKILERSRDDDEWNMGSEGWKLLHKPFWNYRFIGVTFKDVGSCHGYRLLQFTGQSTKYVSLMGCGFWGNTLRTRFFPLLPNLVKLKFTFNFSADIANLILRHVPGGNQRLRFPGPNYRPTEEQVLRKLQSLQLILPGNKERDVLCFLPWKELLDHMPSLKRITFQSYHLSDPHFDPDEIYSKIFGMLEAIGKIREVDNNNIQLTDLDMLNVCCRGLPFLPSSVVEKLNGLQLKLTKLSLDVGCTTSGKLLARLLQPYSAIIEELTLFQLVGSGPLLQFPFGLKMSSLRVLHIHGNIVGDLGFLQGTPKLESLHIFYDSRIFYPGKYARPENMSEVIRKTPRMRQDVIAKTLKRFSMKNVCLKKLEDLQGDFKVTTRRNFKKLTEWMPNVRTLYLPVSTLTLPVACKGWSHSLRIWKIPKWCDLDDEAITGIKWSDQGFLKGTGERLPNITDMKGLTSFSFVSRGVKSMKPADCEHPITSLSECSIVEGFLHLPSLSTLHICTARPVRKENLTALEQNVETVVICDCIDHCSCGSNALKRNRVGSKHKLFEERQEADEQTYVASQEIDCVQERLKEIREREDSEAAFDHAMRILVRNVLSLAKAKLCPPNIEWVPKCSQT